MTNRKKDLPTQPRPPRTALELAEAELFAASNALGTAYEYARGVDEARARLLRAGAAYNPPT